MEELKILLLCSSRFVLPVMQQLAYFGQLKAVIIPAHCTELIDESAETLKAAGIPLIIAEKVNFTEKALEAINSYSINSGLVATFSYIIPRSVFSLPEKGFYNIHPGPLPAYRGADPIFHQIKNREKHAGVTIHKLDEGLDTGEIVLQESIPLSNDDTYGILAMKLSQLAAKLTGTLTKILSLGFAVPSKPQDETKAHYYEKQALREITIDWDEMSADDIIALSNACNPHNKGAATRINSRYLHLLFAEKSNADVPAGISPGTILTLDDEIMEVATKDAESLSIKFIYTEEGFITPSHMMKTGFMKGMRLENLFSKK